MKGQTIIELKDVNTGDTERVVYNNMITKGVEQFYANLGRMNNANVSYDSQISELLGGIALFDEAIEEDANITIPPSGIGMTGHASYGETYTGTENTYGSFNEAESGWQADGSFVQVYDFNADQANGRIACVCLTSKYQGKAGFGNANGVRLPNQVAARPLAGSVSKMTTGTGGPGVTYENVNSWCRYPYNISYENSTVSVLRKSNIYRLAYNADLAAEHYSNTGKVNIDTYRIPMTKIPLNGTFNNQPLIDTHEITLPQEIMARSDVGLLDWSWTDNGDVWIIRGGYDAKNPWTAARPLLMLKIDSEFNTTLYQVANTTGDTITDIGQPVVVGGNVLIMKSTTELYVIDIATGQSKTITTYPLNDANLLRRTMRINGNSVVFSTSAGSVKVDIDTETSYIISESYNADYVYNCCDNPMVAGIVSYDSGGTLCYFSIVRMSDYIGSINNLDEPVTKTAERTMRVTYRLTF